MSRSIHFVTQNAPGFGLTDRRSLPCPGISGRAVSLSPFSSCGDHKAVSQIKIIPFKGMPFVCSAGPNSDRRNPDFSKQNKKQWFSRNRNKQNIERDGSENLEESEELYPKNGPLHSASGAPKFQATATPGPREREIVELFRKVQAQLREGASSLKEEKKPEETQERGNESESVDSLLKLLRKHNTKPGKSSSRSLISDRPEPNGANLEKKSTTFLNSNTHVKDEVRGRESPPLGRPVSNFQRRSPVPQVSKLQPVPSDSVKDTWINGKRESSHQEPETDEPKLVIEAESSFSDGDMLDRMSADEDLDIDDVYSEEEEEEAKPIVDEDLIAMKLPELRALAKSRGLKGYSKLKKNEIMVLLSAA